MKLWCDTVLSYLDKSGDKYKIGKGELTNINPLEYCIVKADELVKAFDERFNKTKNTLKDNGLVSEPPKAPLARMIGCNKELKVTGIFKHYGDIKEIEPFLNEILNKALIGKKSIKNATSNKIADFISKYLKEENKEKENIPEPPEARTFSN